MEKRDWNSSFSSLPEGCISHILCLTSPRDVCRCSAVSSIFRSAAESDAVWERFLPSDYSEILARSVSPLGHFSSKKDLYFRLCSPLLVDGGRRALWSERSSGKKCVTVSATDLSIAWGDDQRYWRWVSTPPASVFPEAAQLRHVWWFHVHGRIETAVLSPATGYTIHFILIHHRHHFGWDRCPIELSLQGHTRREVLTTDVAENVLQPCVQMDGWMEVEIGEFLCDGDGGEIEFGMREVSSLKGGISILGVAVRPIIP